MQNNLSSVESCKSLYSRENVNVCKLLHLPEILSFYHFLIIEQDPGRLVSVGDILAYKSNVMAVVQN